MRRPARRSRDLIAKRQRSLLQRPARCRSSSGFLLALVLLAACGKTEAGPSGGKGKRNLEFPVETVAVTTRPVEFLVHAVGTVEPHERVQVTARVAGAVERVHFVEGDTVKEGQILVEIEPLRFGFAAQSAQATVARAEAARDEAKAALARREQAVAGNPGMIADSELDTHRARVRTAEADVAAAKAALGQAWVNQRDATVRAPAAGVVQSRSVATGQYVQPGAVLATLIDPDPLLVRFSVAEADAGRLRLGATLRFDVAGGPAHEARLRWIADAADATTRMVPALGEVVGATAGLRPGAFAEVVVPVGEVAGVVVPELAVRPSDRGYFAYVVEDGVARRRSLTLGLRTGAGEVEIRDGLKAGDQLVIRGVEALRDGVKVKLGAGKPGKPEAGGRPEAASPDAPSSRPVRAVP